MKLTTVVVSAIMALGVAAVPFAEAGNDVDVEARDFSGESLTEFDARSPEEEEFETRDEEDDLVARTDYNRCGYGAYEKNNKCYCRDHKLVYNEHKKKCEKPFSCKGKYVKIVEEGYDKKCVCEREGQTYNKWKGCECAHGYEYSEHYEKCIPECKYGEEYDGHSCKPPFSCKGKNVEIVEVDGKKSCKCKVEHQEYSEKYGCKCVKGYDFSWKENKCIKDCPYGTKLEHDQCVPICKGEAYYKHGQCYCKSKSQYYDAHEGCKDRCPEGTSYDWAKKECKCEKYGQVYDKHQKKCYTPCKGRDVKLEWKNYEPTCVCEKKDEIYNEHKGCIDRCPGDNNYFNGHECVCKRGYISRHGKCVKKPECKGYGSYFDVSEWSCKCRKDSDKYVEHKGCVDRCPNEHDSWNSHSRRCECEHGYVSRHGKCEKPKDCGYGAYFDKHAWQCKCKDEQKKFEHGRCVDRCPGENNYFNSWTKKCECKKGYYSRHGKCVKKSYGGY